MTSLHNRLSRWWAQLRYDRYWRSRPATWSYGINVIDQATGSGNYQTVLDAGCGRGDVVAHLQRQGYEAQGIELSAHAVDRGVARPGSVVQGSLDRLPFPDKSFDLVFSSEVLEHIPAASIPAVVRELVRVCRTRLFLTISLRPSSQNNAFHVTLRPRQWWEEHFIQAGALPNRSIMDQWQRRGNFTNRQVLEQGPAAGIINEMSSFVEVEAYSFNGELEPWYFVFDR